MSSPWPRDNRGPLQGVRVIEIAGIGAAPYASMMLADAGADVIRIDRLERPGDDGEDLIAAGRRLNVVGRGRRSIGVDLKSADGLALLLDLVSRCEVLIESFRPGVAERLGFGPEVCLRANPALVYGRLTGWGQTGPLRYQAGHDINYLALSGTLDMIGLADGPPVIPLNLIADFGGGGMMIAFGVLASLLEARATGRGQVVDSAMVEGAASLATYIHSMRQAGTWVDERGQNVLDGGAPFYSVYRTSDNRFVAVGAVEAQFYARVLDGLGLDPRVLPAQLDRTRWPELRTKLSAAFAGNTLEHWSKVFADRDACVTPVLTAAEAPYDGHLQDRQTFIEVSGTIQPAPVPRFSRPAPRPGAPVSLGEGGRSALQEWGVPESSIDELIVAGVIHAI